MQIYTVQFNYEKRSDYGLLLDVFEYSVKKNMPDVEFIAEKIPAPKKINGRALNFNYNTVKLDYWVNHLKNTDQNVIFADCDMLCINPAYHAFKEKFDVGYTERTYIKRIPMNGGIMFARPTERAIAFFQEMKDNNDQMLEDIDFHDEWRHIYAGMNQAAFGCTLETGINKARIKKFKTNIWNAVDCDWHRLNNNVVFIHYKSKLRKCVLRECKPRPELKKPIWMWNQMHNMMLRGKI